MHAMAPDHERVLQQSPSSTCQGVCPFFRSVGCAWKSRDHFESTDLQSSNLKLCGNDVDLIDFVNDFVEASSPVVLCLSTGGLFVLLGHFHLLNLGLDVLLHDGLGVLVPAQKNAQIFTQWFLLGLLQSAVVVQLLVASV